MGATIWAPRFRFIASVPEGQFNAERRQAIVAAITEAVLDAEQGAHPRDPMRVWVFTPEVPDGTSGGGGRIVTLGPCEARSYDRRCRPISTATPSSRSCRPLSKNPARSKAE